MTTNNNRSKRINMRISPTALDNLKAAATANEQDVTAFVLGAAMDKARDVLIEQTLITLTPHEILQLEKSLTGPAQRSQALVDLFAKTSAQVSQ